MIDFSLQAQEAEQLGNRTLVGEEHWTSLVRAITSDSEFQERFAGRSERVRVRWAECVADQTLAFLWLLCGNPKRAAYPPSLLVALGCRHFVQLEAAAQFRMTASELQSLCVLWSQGEPGASTTSTVAALQVHGLKVIQAVWR